MINIKDLTRLDNAIQNILEVATEDELREFKKVYDVYGVFLRYLMENADASEKEQN